MSNEDEHIQQLRNRLIEAIADAPELTKILRGTVGKRFVRCGKPGCRCQEGEGHGPVYYFSISLEVGKTKQVSLTEETYELAQQYLRNYNRLRTILEEVSTINREILQEESRARRRRRATKKEG